MSHILLWFWRFEIIVCFLHWPSLWRLHILSSYSISAILFYRLILWKPSILWSYLMKATHCVVLPFEGHAFCRLALWGLLILSSYFMKVTHSVVLLLLLSSVFKTLHYVLPWGDLIMFCEILITNSKYYLHRYSILTKSFVLMKTIFKSIFLKYKIFCLEIIITTLSTFKYLLPTTGF